MQTRDVVEGLHSPNPPRVLMRLYKHGKSALLLNGMLGVLVGYLVTLIFLHCVNSLVWFLNFHLLVTLNRLLMENTHLVRL